MEESTLTDKELKNRAEINIRNEIMIQENHDKDHEEKAEENFRSFPEESPEEIALRIPTVLDTLVKNLELKDLKAFRLVNLTWNTVASHFLLKNKNLYSPIYFQFDEELKKDFLCQSKFQDNDYQADCYYYVDSRKISLNDLVKCLTPSSSSSSTTNFPCSSFGFIGGYLVEPEVEQFFSLHGSKITTLRLDHHHHQSASSTVDRATLQSILIEKLPNLECLELGHFPKMFDDLNNDDGSDLVGLVNLKSLACLNTHSFDSTAFRLLGHAPKLTTVYNFKSNYINNFLGTKYRDQNHKVGNINNNNVKSRVATIKHFVFNVDLARQSRIDWGQSIQNMTVFTDTHPQLQHLTIPFNKVLTGTSTADDVNVKIKLCQALHSLLQSSKDTLKILEVDTFSQLIPSSSDLPQLKNVETLKLLSVIREEKPDEFMPIFPRGINLFNIFPSVKSVVCEFVCDSQSIKKYFPVNGFTGNLPTVETLEVILPSSFDGMRDLMPNVRKITINPLQSVKYEISFLHLAYPDLEEIHFKYPPGVWLTDAAFIGISEKDLSILEKTDDLFWSKSYDFYKAETSILDFKNLKRLRISIANKDLDLDSVSDMRLPSRISGLVFQQNPDLQVMIAYHQHCASASILAAALESIAPYVQLVHENLKQDRKLQDIVSVLHNNNSLDEFNFQVV